jgi:uncharacterized protein (DUF1697 family)
MGELVILLRGVNVGRGNRIAMADWRAQLEGLGYRAVRTLLASGNAVCAAGEVLSAAVHAQRIGDALAARFDIRTPVIVKSGAEFCSIVDEAPMVPEAADHSRFLVAFAGEPSALVDASERLPAPVPPERFVVTSRAAYLYCPGGLLESPVAEALLGKVGRALTTRNWGTVSKMRAMLGASA